MCAPVDDVHHGNGKHIGVATTDVFVEGKVEVVGSSLGNSEGNAEDGVCAEVRLGIGTVELEHSLVDGNLVEGAHTLEGFSDGAVYVGDSLEDTFAHVTALVAVTEFESLVHTGGCAGGNRSTATSAAFEDYIDFNSGVAA